jgi:hypothetical protein
VPQERELGNGFVAPPPPLLGSTGAGWGLVFGSDQ